MYEHDTAFPFSTEFPGVVGRHDFNYVKLGYHNASTACLT